MHRERRIIWSEDRYRLFEREGEDRYYGRAKGDFYVVYRKHGDSVRRETLQVVSCEHDGFWDSASKRITHESPSEVLLDSPLALSLAPQEHVLSGYLNSRRIENLSEISEDGHRAPMTMNEVSLSSGAKVILLSPKTPSGWVVSLHGGPESLEGTEIRYGGLYRELLRQGLGVAILNYRGSTGIEKPKAISWRSSVEADFDSLVSVLGASSDVSLLGASFGGALASLIAQTRNVNRTLLVSPLLDLSHQRDRGGDEFRLWFDENFSKADFQDIRPVALPRVGMIFGTQDEVLGCEMFKTYATMLGTRANRWVCHYDGPHQPVTYRDVRTQLEHALHFLTESTEILSESVDAV